MPTLTIGDQKVKVDDGFLKLSPDEQNAAVEEIAKTLGGGGAPAAQPPAAAPAVAAVPEQPLPPPKTEQPAGDAYSRVAGLAKAAGTGVAKGVIGTIGLVPMLADLMQTGVDKVVEPILGPRPDKGKRFDINKAASPDSIQRGIETVTGDFYKPQNTAEKYVETVGSFLPGAAAGPGSAGTRLVMQAMLPGVASEAAGQATEGTAFEPYARFGAAIAAPVSATMAMRALPRAGADGMGRGASRHLVNAMEADTPAAVRAELDRLGPDAMLADAGPAFLGKAQGASLNSDQGRSILFGATKRRDVGTNQRIQDDVDLALGSAKGDSAAEASQRIIALRSDLDGKNYPQVLATAPPVRTAPILRELDDAIAGSVGNEQKALVQLKSMMMRPEKQPRINPWTKKQEIDGQGRPIFDDVPVSQDRADVLHKVKQELDNVIEYDAPGLGVPAGALKNQQASLKRFRHDINQTLEDQVEGYARSNRVSQRLAKRADAVDKGTQYLGEGKTTPSPSKFLDDWEQLDLGERVAFAKGSRSEIERKLGTKTNDLQALRSELQGEGGWNTAKIATVHGDDAAADLMASVERNLKFRDTHNKISEGAQTEIRRAAREQMKPAGFKESDIVTPAGNWLGMGLTAVKKGGAKILNAIDGRRQNGIRTEVAEILASSGAERDRHVQAIVDALSRQKAGASKHSASTAGQRAIAAAMMAQVGAYR